MFVTTTTTVFIIDSREMPNEIKVLLRYGCQTLKVCIHIDFRIIFMQ